MHRLLPTGFALALATPLGAVAEPPSDVQALRQEIQAIRAEYEARLNALEQRLRAAEAAAATPAPAGPRSPPVPATSARGGPNAFNPAVSLILSGLYTRTSQDPANYAISGGHVPRSLSISPAPPGFSLSDAQL